MTFSLFRPGSRITCHALAVLAGSLTMIAIPGLSANAQAVSGYYGGGYDRNTGSSATRLIYCESDEYRRESCSTGGDAERVFLQDRKSDARCNHGQDWGFDRNRIWVSNGCRAVFAVQYRSSYGGGYGGGYDRPDYDRPGYGRPGYGRPGYDRPGNSYAAHRDQAVRQCRQEAESRFRRDNIHGARFDRLNYVRQDRDGRGWLVSLEYDIGRGYRGGGRERDIQCHYERGRANLLNYRYAGDWDRDHDRDRGRGRY